MTMFIFTPRDPQTLNSWLCCGTAQTCTEGRAFLTALGACQVPKMPRPPPCSTCWRPISCGSKRDGQVIARRFHPLAPNLPFAPPRALSARPRAEVRGARRTIQYSLSRFTSRENYRRVQGPKMQAHQLTGKAASQVQKMPLPPPFECCCRAATCSNEMPEP